MFRSVPLAVPLLLVVALALGACGRRGPLEPPPGSAPPSPRAEARAAAIDPASQSNATRPSLARDTSGQESLDREKVIVPVAPVTVPNTPFILDPLL